MAKFRIIMVVESEIDDSSFGTVERNTEKWARMTEDQFREDPGALFEYLDSEFDSRESTVSVVPLD